MTRQMAIIVVLFGAFLMSFVGILMRMLSDATGFQILFYRSISLSLLVLSVICFRRQCAPKKFIEMVDRYDLWMGLWLALAFTFYIFSMLYTSVASTLLILTIVPFLAAVIAWIWIAEIPHPITWPTMIIAVFGVGLMFYDGSKLGYSFGNICALIASFCFAVMLVIVRHSGKQDVLGGTFMAGIYSVLFGFFGAFQLDGGLSISQTDMLIIFFMGAFTIGLGISMVTAGTVYLPAAEVSLLVLIESVLGPLWPWIFLGEALSRSEILGGLITLTAVIVLIVFSQNPKNRTNLSSLDSDN